MVRCMKLELFVLRSASQEYLLILQNVFDVLFKHHEQLIVKECIQTLNHAAMKGPEELKVKHSLLSSR